MEKKLHLLESFNARGSDGAMYKVCGYEHMVLDESVVADGLDHWEPTGQAEYRLATGEHVEVQRDGAMRVAASGVELTPEPATAGSEQG